MVNKQNKKNKKILKSFPGGYIPHDDGGNNGDKGDGGGDNNETGTEQIDSKDNLTTTFTTTAAAAADDDNSNEKKKLTRAYTITSREKQEVRNGALATNYDNDITALDVRSKKKKNKKKKTPPPQQQQQQPLVVVSDEQAAKNIHRFVTKIFSLVSSLIVNAANLNHNNILIPEKATNTSTVTTPKLVDELYDTVDLIVPIVRAILQYNNIVFNKIKIYETQPNKLTLLEPIEYFVEASVVDQEDLANAPYKNTNAFIMSIINVNPTMKNLYQKQYEERYYESICKTHDLSLIIDKNAIQEYLIQATSPFNHKFTSGDVFDKIPQLHRHQINLDLFSTLVNGELPNEINKVSFLGSKLIATVVLCDHIATHIIYDMNVKSNNNTAHALYHENFKQYGTTLHTMFDITTVTNDALKNDIRPYMF